MCVNNRVILNRYTGKDVFCSCGRCSSCLQSKADKRSTMIRFNTSPDMVQYFITLTYQNKYIPYILQSDISKFIDDETFVIPVYRDFTRRYFKTANGVELRDVPVSQPIAFSMSSDFKIKRRPADITFFKNKVRKLHPLRDIHADSGLYGYGDRIGVALFSDFQKFIKRLSAILSRQYGFSGKFSYFLVTEYGSSYSRPHAHIALSAPKTLPYYVLKSAVNKAWPYDSNDNRKCQIAKDISSYLASYVNSNTYVSPLLRYNDLFKTKYSFSKGFGALHPAFRLSKVLESAAKVDFTFDNKEYRSGCLISVTRSIPTYVINRLFPKFTGFTRTSDDAIIYVLSRCGYNNVFNALEGLSRSLGLNFHYDQLHSITNRILLKQKIYGNSQPYRYALDYVRVWNAYKAFQLKQNHLQHDGIFAFDNLGSVRPSVVGSWLGYLPLSVNEFNPNKYPFRVAYTDFKTSRYHLYDKSKKVKNHIYSQINFYNLF